MERTELIEKAAKAMADASPDATWEDLTETERDWYLRDARAALAVIEEQRKPSEDERTWVTGFLLGCGVSADRADEYAGKFLAGFRRPVSPDDYPDAEGLATLRSQEPQAEPSDAQAWAAARAVAALRKQETGVPAWFNVEHARAALRAAAVQGEDR